MTRFTGSWPAGHYSSLTAQRLQIVFDDPEIGASTVPRRGRRRRPDHFARLRVGAGDSERKCGAGAGVRRADVPRRAATPRWQTSRGRSMRV